MDLGGLIDDLKQSNSLTKAVLAAAMALIIYGYLCRIIGFYFFWESKLVGWFVFLIGIILFLLETIKIKKADNKETIPYKIGIGIIAFVLIFESAFMIILPRSDAYSAATKYVLGNPEIKAEVGEIKTFTLIPIGSIEMGTNAEGSYGNAVINVLIKGDKAFKDLSIYVVKDIDKAEWVVEKVE
jgi:asparagine N-glycosylation enzyme membrane subunit Stt3